MKARAFLRPFHAVAVRAARETSELMVRVASIRAGSRSPPPSEPRSLFVLRNNDIGDVLVATPLFQALRDRFPEASLVAGVGNWSLDVLRHNPHVSEAMTVDAPWHNKYVPAQSPWDRIAYLRRHPQVEALVQRRFEVGIDVLGSAWGSLLLLRAHIPYRLGVRGYAGGHSAAQATVTFDPAEHVARMALRFAELLGAERLPLARPQLFLAEEERADAELWWRDELPGARRPRILIAPGGGLQARLWPAEGYALLSRDLVSGTHVVGVLAGRGEEQLSEEVARGLPGIRVVSPPLREVFAVIAASDLVVCNSSMAMHVAAAFGKPTIVMLGDGFPSAAGHQAQWGYPGLTQSLGREEGQRASIFSPAEALAVVRSTLRQLRAA